MRKCVLLVEVSGINDNYSYYIDVSSWRLLQQHSYPHIFNPLLSLPSFSSFVIWCVSHPPFSYITSFSPRDFRGNYSRPEFCDCDG
jgi:hypothetical protein